MKVPHGVRPSQPPRPFSVTDPEKGSIFIFLGGGVPTPQRFLTKQTTIKIRADLGTRTAVC